MISYTHHLFTLGLVYIVAITAVAADARQIVPVFVKRLAPLGQLTYSMYMWHPVIVLILMNVVADKLVHASPGLMSVFCVICYAIIFVVAYLSYFFIESPARRYIDSLGSGRAFGSTDAAVFGHEPLLRIRQAESDTTQLSNDAQWPDSSRIDARVCAFRARLGLPKNSMQDVQPRNSDWPTASS